MNKKKRKIWKLPLPLAIAAIIVLLTGGGYLIYALTKSTEAAGPVAYWKFDEGAGTIAYDASGNGNDGALTNFDFDNDSNWTSGKVAGALQFDGTDDYVEIPAGNGSFADFDQDNFTIEAWFKTSDSDGDIVGAGDAGDNDYWGIGVSGGKALFYFKTGATATNTEATSTESVDDNEWHHLVGVRYALRDGKLYLDGEEKIDWNIGGVAAAVEITTNMFVGKKRNDTLYLDGLIDEVKIYNRALSADEIRWNYNRGGPVGWWKFDEGSGQEAFDSSGLGNNGQLGSTTASDAGDPTWTSGKINGALSFGGSDDSVNVGSDSSLDIFEGKDWTVEAWIKPDVKDHNHFILTKFDSGDTRKSLQLFIHSNNNIMLSYWGDDLTVSKDWDALTWYHVVFTNIGATRERTIYWNGEIIGSDTSSGDLSDIADNDVLIGSRPDPSPGWFDGLIDDVRIYNYARTASEIRTDYNFGQAVRFGTGDYDLSRGLVGHWDFEEGSGYKAYDSSNEGNEGTLTNFNFNENSGWTSGNAAANTGQALKFDGTDDYIEVASSTSLDVSTGLAVAAWVKPVTVAGGADGFITTRNTASDKRWLLFLDDPTGKFGWQVSAGADQRCDSSFVASANTWYHIVGMWSGTAPQLYINGVLEDTGDGTVSNEITANLLIGDRDTTAGENFDGVIDDVRIYNRALSADEIRYLYNRRGPVGWWKFDEGAASTTYDSSGNGNNGTWYGTSTHWTTGKINGAGSFNGAGDYVNAGSDDSVDIGSSDLTLELWVNGSRTGTIENVIYKYKSNAGYQMYFNNNDYLYVQLYDSAAGGASRGLVIYSTNLRDGNWHHIAYSNDRDVATGGKLYVDGILVGSSSNNCATSLSGISNLYFGTGYEAGTQFFGGLIDDVRIYNYARTAAEIRTDYNEGFATKFGPSDSTGIDLERGLVGHWDFEEGSGYKAYDSSNQANDGTLYNFDFNQDSGWTSGNAAANTGQALEFDGSDDKVIYGTSNDLDFDIDDPFTMTFWARSVGSSFGTADFMGKYASAKGYRVNYDDANSRLSFSLNTTAIDYKVKRTTVNLVGGIWHHVVVTYDGSNTINGMKIFVDGVEDSCTTQQNGTLTDITNSASFTMGYFLYGAISGIMDDVHIYNRALSADEIRYLYNRKQPIGWWKFDSGNSSGTLAYDSSINGNHGTIYGASSTAGKINRALRFDGTDDKVVTNSNLPFSGTDNVTFEAWAKADAVNDGNYRNVFFTPNDEADTHRLGLLENGGSWRIYAYYSGGYQYLDTTITATTNWTHLVLLYDGTIKFYANGVLGYTSAAVTLDFIADEFVIGSYHNSGSPTYYWKGLIDDVRIYNYARTADEIRADYNAGPSTYFK